MLSILLVIATTTLCVDSFSLSRSIRYNNNNNRLSMSLPIDSKHLPNDVNDFVTKLKFSLNHWKVLGRRGIWLKIPVGKSQFITPSLELGFSFHHAEKVINNY